MVRAVLSSLLMAAILIIEDDQRIRERLTRALAERGHAVDARRTGFEGLSTALEDRPDVIVLDLGLPDVDGAELLKMIRAVSSVPVVIATARTDETAIVALLDAGADDYVVKPFSVRELLLRIDVLLRRAGPPRADSGVDQPLRAGPLFLDRGQRRCLVDELDVNLSTTEFDLLQALMERPGRVQTRERLIADVWRSIDEVGVRAVDTHVKRLRSKLGPAGDLVRTVRGIGYVFDRDG